jgi:hypothetical protein
MVFQDLDGPPCGKMPPLLAGAQLQCRDQFAVALQSVCGYRRGLPWSAMRKAAAAIAAVNRLEWLCAGRAGPAIRRGGTDSKPTCNLRRPQLVLDTKTLRPSLYRLATVDNDSAPDDEAGRIRT